MKCPKCGSDVREGATFCINCGAKVGEITPKGAAPAEREKPIPKETKPARPEPAKPEPEPAKPAPEPAKPEPVTAKPAELAAGEAAAVLPEPDRKIEEGPKTTGKTPITEEKPYRDYRRPITAVIFIIIIVCSVFACCAFCVFMASTRGGY